MSKNACFRGSFHNHHGKQAKNLFKPVSQHFYSVYWKLSRELSWEKSLWLTRQILGLLVKILAADGKYPVLNTVSVMIPIQMQLSQKKKFSSIFCWLFEMWLKFWTFSKRNMTLIDFVFPKLPTPKTWVDKCLKSLV